MINKAILKKIQGRNPSSPDNGFKLTVNGSDIKDVIYRLINILPVLDPEVSCLAPREKEFLYYNILLYMDGIDIYSKTAVELLVNKYRFTDLGPDVYKYRKFLKDKKYLVTEDFKSRRLSLMPIFRLKRSDDNKLYIPYIIELSYADEV